MSRGRWYVMSRGKRLQNGILYVAGDKLHYEEARRVLDTICSCVANVTSSVFATR